MLLEKKENFELTTQKELRTQKANEIARLDKLIEISINNVKDARAEKVEIERQKIELAK